MQAPTYHVAVWVMEKDLQQEHEHVRASAAECQGSSDIQAETHLGQLQTSTLRVTSAGTCKVMRRLGKVRHDKSLVNNHL